MINLTLLSNKDRERFLQQNNSNVKPIRRANLPYRPSDNHAAKLSDKYAQILSHPEAAQGRHKALAMSFAGNAEVTERTALSILDRLAGMPPSDTVETAAVKPKARSAREARELDELFASLEYPASSTPASYQPHFDTRNGRQESRSEREKRELDELFGPGPTAA